MATRKVNPLEEHFEKGLLGIAAVVLVYTLVSFTLSSSLGIQIGSQFAPAGQVYYLVRQQSDQIDQKVKDQETQWPKLQLPVSGNSAQIASALELTGLPDKLKTDLPAAVAIRIEITPEQSTLSKYDLPVVQAPQKIVFSTGRVVLDLTNQPNLQGILQVDETQIERSYTTVAGQIDLDKQRKALSYLPDALDREPIFFQVDLQRAMLAPGIKDENLKWEDVPYTLDGNQTLIVPGTPLMLDSMDNLTAKVGVFSQRASEYESYGMTPEFPPTLLWGPEKWNEWKDPTETDNVTKTTAEAKTREKPAPGAEKIKPTLAPRPIRSVRGGREPGPGPGGMPSPMGGAGSQRGTAGRNINQPMAGPGGVIPPGPGGVPGGYGMTPPGVMVPSPPGMIPPGPGGRMMPGGRFQQQVQSSHQPIRMTDEEHKKLKVLKVWFHDLTAAPGKTYKYRMRVVMFNPVAGYTPILKKADDGLKIGIAGPWSSPTPPIRVAPESFFFVSGTGEGGKSASIPVYKWYLGWLYKEIFDVKPGQPIGSKKTVTNVYRFENDGLHAFRKEIDFSTGAVLQGVTGNVEVTVHEPTGGTRRETATVASIKLPDGSIIKQDTSNNNYDKDARNCKAFLMEQQKILKPYRGQIIQDKTSGETE